MPRSVVVGIDPGANGAIGIIDSESLEFVEAIRLPGDDLIEWKNIIKRISQNYNVRAVWLEKVHAFPGQGVVSMFSFGMQFGLAGLAAIMITDRTFYVHPRVWKRKVIDAMLMKEANNTKKASLMFARRMWPEAGLSKAKDEGIAEALCIALYGARKEGSKTS
jgi:crossover junction endodeoxyribonuclease RuvC